MTTPSRKAVALAAGPALLTFAMAALIPPIGAQEARTKPSPAKAKPSASARKAAEDDEAPKAKAKGKSARPSRRLPTYYGGLNLTDEQKESIYEIEAKYQPEIQDLEKQADALRERLASECEDVLTAVQKRALADTRQSASERRKAAAAKRKSEVEAEEEPEDRPEEKAEPVARKPATID